MKHLLKLAAATAAIAMSLPAAAADFVTFTVLAHGMRTSFSSSTPPGGGIVDAVNLTYAITVDLDPGTGGAPGNSYFSDGSHFTANYIGATDTATFNGNTLFSASHLFSTTGYSESWDLTRALQGSTTGVGYRIENIVIDGISTANSATLPHFSLVVSAALPELGTWATMVFGFGVVGFAMRRGTRPTPISRGRDHLAA